MARWSNGQSLATAIILLGLAPGWQQATSSIFPNKMYLYDSYVYHMFDYIQFSRNTGFILYLPLFYLISPRDSVTTVGKRMVSPNVPPIYVVFDWTVVGHPMIFPWKLFPKAIPISYWFNLHFMTLVIDGCWLFASACFSIHTKNCIPSCGCFLKCNCTPKNRWLLYFMEKSPSQIRRMTGGTPRTQESLICIPQNVPSVFHLPTFW